MRQHARVGGTNLWPSYSGAAAVLEANMGVVGGMYLYLVVPEKGGGWWPSGRVSAWNEANVPWFKTLALAFQSAVAIVIYCVLSSKCNNSLAWKIKIKVLWESPNTPKSAIFLLQNSLLSKKSLIFDGQSSFFFCFVSSPPPSTL